MDISRGKVIDCEFIESGNDSLDLMTAKVVVNRTKILDAGDKGISVGEGSTLLVTESQFVRCFIGIEAKDTSRAFVYNSLFDDNKLIVNAYKKNWRYGLRAEMAMLRACRLTSEIQRWDHRRQRTRLLTGGRTATMAKPIRADKYVASLVACQL